MESDFVTNQHVESLQNSDAAMREILNRYKSAPNNPSPHQHFSGFSGISNPGGVGHTDAVLLSNMLGQVLANSQRGNFGATAATPASSDGFQLNINSDVLKWVVLLLLVLLLVWLFLRANKKRKNPLRKRLALLEDELLSLKKKSHKKIKSDEDDEDSDED